MTDERQGLKRGGWQVVATRRALRARDGDRCRRCGGVIDFSRSGLDPLGPNVGHVLPAAHGGGDELTNLGLEHRTCNRTAGASMDPVAIEAARIRSSSIVSTPRAAIATPFFRTSTPRRLASEPRGTVPGYDYLRGNASHDGR